MVDPGSDDPPASPLQLPPNERMAIVFERALVGAVHKIPVDSDVPTGWHLCDGSELPCREWPQFVAMMRIATGSSFTLPNVPAQGDWATIVKLGAHRPQEPVNFDAIPTEILPPAEMARRLLQQDE